ncbi:twin transmembrane helix small protein [Enterovirga aerilata]|uniref:Twin transmembrane helix small protein n=1 Tax=Enterovirga aerilata TaxID=2730920 RepID=A0A849I6F7_9HYPH|nr:twin transmembrane helix small protein [Enterovirga sp. DB1703]
MSGSSFVVLLATLAVAAVLLLGLGNMMRGGPAQRSQSLMRLRVLLQFGAIVLIMIVLWWRAASGA